MKQLITLIKLLHVQSANYLQICCRFSKNIYFIVMLSWLYECDFKTSQAKLLLKLTISAQREYIYIHGRCCKNTERIFLKQLKFIYCWWNRCVCGFKEWLLYFDLPLSSFYCTMAKMLSKKEMFDLVYDNECFDK